MSDILLRWSALMLALGGFLGGSLVIADRLRPPPPAPAITSGTVDSPLPQDETAGAARSTRINEPVSAEDLAAITQRPLFHPDRRPAKPAVKTARTTPAPPPTPSPPAPRLRPGEIVLLGVIIIDDQPVALLRVRGEASPVRAVRGARIAGWEVVEIDDQHIVLAQRQTRIRLPLDPERR